MVAPNGQAGNWTLAWDDEFNNAAGMSGHTNGLAATKWNVGWYYGPSAPGGTGYKGLSYTASSGAGAVEFYGPGALAFPAAGGMQMSNYASGQGPDGASYNAGGHSSSWESGGVNTAGLMNITPNTSYSVPSAIASTVIQAASIVVEISCEFAGPETDGSYWQYIGHYNCGDSDVPSYPDSGTWSGEIDLWEQLGSDCTGSSFDIHFHAGSTYNGPTSITSALQNTDLSAGTHIYTVEYTYSTIALYVDGVQVQGINPTAAECEGQWATPQYLNLQLQLRSGYTAVTGVNGVKPWTVNYVRVFTPGTAPPPPSITSTGSISLSPFGFSGQVNTGQAGTIAVDPSTPAVVTATGTTSASITSASFSPPANTLITVLTCFEYQASSTTAPKFTVSDTSGGTYTAGPAMFDGTRGMTATWTRYVYNAPGPITVTVSNSAAAATHGQALAVYVLDGANSIQAKAATATAYSSAGTTAWTGAITTTTLGSWVMLAAAGDVEGTISANSSTVTLENEQDATDKVSLLTGRQAFSTGGVNTGGGGGGGGTGTSTGGLYITTPDPPTAQISQAYSCTLLAQGGSGTGYQWTVSTGALPAGLSLSQSGVISGTPTGSAAVTDITAKVLDSLGNTATQALIITTITGPVGGPGGSWDLVFSDEFNVAYPTPYGTGPNMNKWADHLINGDLFRTNDDGEVQWYPHGFYAHSISGSVMTLNCVWQNPTAIDPTCPTGIMLPGDSASEVGTATSGMISSHLSYGFTYGYVEIYMEHGSAQSLGPWPQMALYTRDNVWPPEIDVDEFNPPNHQNQTHNGYDNPSDVYQSYYFTPGSGYHAWGMEITASNVNFYFDGSLTYSASNQDSAAYAWFLIYTLAAQYGSSSSAYPYSVGIDYIRAWVPAGVPAAPVITSISPANGLTTSGSITVNFNTVAGATSYRATASPTDAMADKYGGSDVTDTIRFTATGTSSPLTVTGLPSGVRWNFTVAAINSTGYSPESAPGGPQIIEIQMVTASLPSAVTGTTYSQTLIAQQGNPPYTWAVSSGSLPAGLALNAGTGVISGVATTVGTSSFTVKASGATGWSGGPTVANSATQALSIAVVQGSGGGGGGGGGGGSTGPGNITLGWTSSASGNYAISLLEVLPVIVPLPPALAALRQQARKRASFY